MRSQTISEQASEVKFATSQVTQSDWQPSAAVTIAEMEVEANTDSLMSLGTFTPDDQPRGFCLEYDEDPEPAKSILSEITTRRLGAKLQYLLHVTNGTSRTLNVEIKQL